MMPQEFWRSHAGQVGILPQHQRIQQKFGFGKTGQRARAGFHIES
jgi:hypothetical protein